MTRTIRFIARGLFGAVLALPVTATDAGAIPPSTGLPTINFWRDACEMAAHADDPAEMQRVIDATVFIVEPRALGLNPDGSYYVRTRPFVDFDGMILSPDSPFYGEQAIVFGGLPGRSGFLVGPDSVVTTPHGTGFDPTGYCVLFGYENGALPDGSCVPIDPTRFPASQVRVIDRYDNAGLTLGDYLVAHLSEPVPDRPFLRVRRSGHAEVGDAITLVGHPARLPKKIDTAAHVIGLAGNGPTAYLDGDVPLAYPVHSIAFSSGSPLYNLSRQYVELAVMTGSCGVFRPDQGSLPQTHTLVSDCGPPGPLNSPIKTFAPRIERIVLETAPLSVRNIGTAAAGFAQPVTTYTLVAPSRSAYAAAAIDYRIEMAAPVIGEPDLSLLSSVPLEGSLDAGTSLSFDVAAVMPPGQACGVFEREFVVHDLTHGLSDRVHQTLEVAQTVFDADRTVLEMAGIEQPYVATRTFQIRNLRPAKAFIRVRADQNWVTIDGVSGSSGGAPQTGLTIGALQSATVTIGLAVSANGLALHTAHQASIVVSGADPACTLTPDISVPVRFTPGTLQFRQAIDATVPPAAATGPAPQLIASIEVDENFCVDEVKASYVFDHESGAFETAAWLAESQWALQRPGSAAWMPLWDRDAVPACVPPGLDAPDDWCYLYNTKEHCDFGTPGHNGRCDTVAVGDTRRPPLPVCTPGSGCEPFAGRIGKPARGTWTMRLGDRVVDGVSSQPRIRGWSLTFRGRAACTN
ncbi:MAG TPA: trypsin-like peptidase domain-containing protein [Dokdonella sp.]|uniref:trypsin-like serine peptidase n=1 Tax=Dokdonella sp. TaxID=2291710 RepID=UPI002C20871A|nr:trypsin-like peptidase domain-containing protein [Dokdonella sp.]HUD41709.1 trypsin-like peptidase domain-containing protein [Dokdonella sp.]